MEAPSGERLRGKRQVWCLLQLKLCDPCLSALEWFVTIQGAIQVLGFFRLCWAGRTGVTVESTVVGLLASILQWSNNILTCATSCRQTARFRLISWYWYLRLLMLKHCGSRRGLFAGTLLQPHWHYSVIRIQSNPIQSIQVFPESMNASNPNPTLLWPADAPGRRLLALISRRSERGTYS